MPFSTLTEERIEHMILKKSHGVPGKKLSGTFPVGRNFSLKPEDFSYEYQAS